MPVQVPEGFEVSTFHQELLMQSANSKRFSHQHQHVEQDVDHDIQFPYDIEDRQALIDSFRKEILRDWINGIFELAGLAQFRILPNADLDYAEIDRVIRDHAAANNLPYVTMNNIKSHHWVAINYECRYVVSVDRRTFTGTAAELEQILCGFKYALWQYWASRPRVKKENIQRHLYHVGLAGWAREVMWHYLPTPLFIEAWRARQAARRV
jgi:hypothetical protein